MRRPIGVEDMRLVEVGNEGADGHKERREGEGKARGERHGVGDVVGS